MHPNFQFRKLKKKVHFKFEVISYVKILDMLTCITDTKMQDVRFSQQCLRRFRSIWI